jgi:hypothetical protein
MATAANWIEQTISVGGTGDLVLGVSSNEGVTFQQAFGADASNVLYTIRNSSGRFIECGTCSYVHATTTLTNRTVEATFDGSTYDDTSPTAINVPAGAIVITPLTYGEYAKMVSDISADLNIDGGTAASVYLLTQVFDGGSASG